MAKKFEIFTQEDLKKFGISDEAIVTALGKVYTNTSIYTRLDSLIELLEACRNHHPDNEKVKLLEKQAADFIGIITGSKADSLDFVIEERKKFRDRWPEYLPNTSLPHTRPFGDESRKDMLRKRVQDHARALGRGDYLAVDPFSKAADDKFKVKMLSDIEKENYRLLPAGGLLWQLKQPNGDERISIMPFDTENCTAHKNEDQAIFVLNPQGELFAGGGILNVFHHSSFQRSGMNAFGGSMTVHDGKVTLINNHSGHYKPKEQQFSKLLEAFISKDLLSDDVAIYCRLSDMIEKKVTKDLHPIETSSKKNVSEEESQKDYFAIIFSHIMSTNIEDESTPLIKSFIITMKTLLEEKSDVISSTHLSEIQEAASELNVTNTSRDQVMEAHKMLREYIKSSPDLLESIGNNIDWLKIPESAIKSSNHLLSASNDSIFSQRRKSVDRPRGEDSKPTDTNRPNQS